MPRNRPRSIHGGRHELGQNFLHHAPTLDHILSLVERTSGPILELGAGDGALTRPLARLGRPLTAIDVDEHRVRRLRSDLPQVRVEAADATRHPFDAEVVVGNVPFHLTTPILRRLLETGRWRHAVLLTQWEVARKRAGVGGGTLMTAQSAPWFVFALEGRVPAWGFRPQPSVDGGAADDRPARVAARARDGSPRVRGLRSAHVHRARELAPRDRGLRRRPVDAPGAPGRRLGASAGPPPPP